MAGSSTMLQLPAWVGSVYWRQAMLSGPTLMIVMALGLEIDPSMAAVLTGTAFTIAFGAARTLKGHRWGAMLSACGGMMLATVLGSLAGAHPVWLFSVAALLTAATAWLSAWDADEWWVCLQVACAFLVASYYPSNSFDTALQRALLVMAGGGAQILLTVLSARLMRAFAEPIPAAPAPAAALAVQPGYLLRYALGAALAVAGALWAARLAGLHNDYWASIAALMVLRPGMHETVLRYLNRLIGTLAGCIVAMLLILWLHDASWMLMICTVLTAAAAFSLQKAHYALLTSTMTATVIFMLAIGHGDPLAATEHRIEATLLGGSMALLAGYLLRLYPRSGASVLA